MQAGFPPDLPLLEPVARFLHFFLIVLLNLGRLPFELLAQAGDRPILLLFEALDEVAMCKFHLLHLDPQCLVGWWRDGVAASVVSGGGGGGGGDGGAVSVLLGVMGSMVPIS